MKRKTTPDQYSKFVTYAYKDVRAGRISWAHFASIVSTVWSLRHASS